MCGGRKKECGGWGAREGGVLHPMDVCSPSHVLSALPRNLTHFRLGSILWWLVPRCTFEQMTLQSMDDAYERARTYTHTYAHTNIWPLCLFQKLLSHRRGSFPARSIQHSCMFLRHPWDAAPASAYVRACMWVMVRREGCWEEGRDVTSPLRCSHTASSAHIRSPPFISFSILPAFYSAAVCVCVRVMTQLWSCDCRVGGVGWEEEGGGHEGGSEWPGAEHSGMTAARRRPTWRPKPEGEVCVNIQNPVYLQSNRLLTDKPASDETKRRRLRWSRAFLQRWTANISQGELSRSQYGHKATFF